MALSRKTAALATLAFASGASAQQLASTSVQSTGDVKWVNAPIAGVATALIDGDMSKGASYFYLRYGAGLVTPPHAHSADHRVTTVTGNLALTVDGKESRLPPGSYFALKDKAKHVAKCEGPDACVMFIHALGPWDLLPAN